MLLIRKSIYRNFIVALLLLMSGLLSAQEKGIEYKIVGTDLYCVVDRSLATSVIDSVLGTCEIKLEDLEKMHAQGSLSPDNWQVDDLNEKRIVLRKSLHSLKGKAKDQRELIALIDNKKAPSAADYNFGYNRFKKPAVTELENGKTRFFLKVEGEPKSILISGTFNEWSTSANPMTPCDSGFYVDLSLSEGVHYYKYIVNGYWLLDPRNLLTESDWEGNTNSVYFKTNHRFTLKGFLDAHQVNLAGSFNNWNDADYTLEKKDWGWARDCYIRPGTHAYKYVVDGEWFLDPGNDVIREDGYGNQNSFMAVGDTFYFYFPIHLDADFVVVSGDFNDWNPEELRMQKTDTGWVLPYVLAPGNYEYRFRVAGQEMWKLDPLNPLKSGPTETANSIKVIGANHHFFYPAKRSVEEVIVTGDFNNWSEWGIQMERRSDGWHADLHLPKGKTRYKFILDGDWVRDPSNPLFEPNEYDGYNSVLWIK